MKNPFTNLKNKDIEKNIEVLLKRYFCPETELFYEFVIDEENTAWFHLPKPEDIKKSIPNPCGWGTGMEDSAMNGSNALDGLVSAYAISKNSDIVPLAEKVCRGLLLCAKSKLDPGFLARSVSPFDGESHYIESSRDQYTHWICSLCNYFDSPLSSPEMKASICAAIEKTAEKCLRDVRKETNYNMLREDGTIGRVNQMWGNISTHEWTRLPSFYLAAYHLTQKTKWFDLYLKYRDEALENSLEHKPAAMGGYMNLQMQCSLRLMYNYETNHAVKEKILSIMQKLSAHGAEKAVTLSHEYCQIKHRDEINFRFKKWNETEPLRQGIINGYNYDNPAQSDRKDNSAFYPVREIAEYAIVAALCPGFKIGNEIIDAITNMISKIDLVKHSSIYAHLLLPCAYAICVEKQDFEI